MPTRAKNNKNGFLAWLRAQFRKRPLPVGFVIAGDILLLGLALVVFSLFHHVLPSKLESIGIVSERESVQVVQSSVSPTQIASPQETPQAGGESSQISQQASSTPQAEVTPTPAPTEAVARVGDFSRLYADKFTATEASMEQVGENQMLYQSPNLHLTFTKYVQSNLVFYVADFYIRDISQFRTALAEDTYGKGYRERTEDIAARNDALIAINGDYYGMRDSSVVIRNGVLYRDSPFQDVCVLYWDGTMETYSNVEFNATEVMENGAYQAWGFGPMLLDENGQTMTEFHSSVNVRNPRTAIGYFAPGHYCFVVVDGRSSESRGVTTAELSLLMYNLGCVRGYNLDGGQTSVMAWDGKVVNQPVDGGRSCSDIVMITEG